MTRRSVRIGRCYRCVYSWRMRRRRPSMCPRCKSTLYNVPVIAPVRIGKGLGVEEIIGPHRTRILRIAREEGVEAMWVFGSVRRREATERSDVDLLVRWGRFASLFEVGRFRTRLEQELGRKVDLVDRGAVHWAMAHQVEAEAVPL
jgi:uncharacterized protein